MKITTDSRRRTQTIFSADSRWSDGTGLAEKRMMCMQLKQIVQAGFCLGVLLAVFSGLTAFSPVHAGESAAALSSDNAPIVSEIFFEVRDDSFRRESLTSLARNLIFIKKGDRFSDARLQNSLEALKLVKTFSHIHVDTRQEPDGIVLLFRLTPYRLIKDIRIRGKYPLFERDVLNAITLYAGAPLVPEKLEQQEKLIAARYQDEGYIAPKVTVKARQDPADGNFVVDVNIDKGAFYIVENLDIKGNTAFADARLRWMMKTRTGSPFAWQSGRFFEKKLKEDIRRLIDFYRRRQYPEVVIEPATKKDPVTGSVSVVLTINEGPYYKIIFEGNHAFGTHQLKKDLVLFTEGNQNDLGLKKSLSKINTRYRNDGFLQARITIEEKKEDQDGRNLRVLRLIIAEGPRSIVDSIHIAANSALDEDNIKKQMLTRLPGFLEKGAFVPETLQEDLAAIKALYLKHGYMDTQVRAIENHNLDNHKVALNLDITENVQTLVDSVSITGLSAILKKEAEAALTLKTGEPFRTYMLQSDENALSALISEKGYPHVKVQSEVTIRPDRSKADIIYHVDQGPYVTMGQIFFSGNLRTHAKILCNEISLKPGEPFSLKRMLEAQRNIRSLAILNSVRFKAVGLKEKADNVDLVVDVEEKKSYYVESGLGYENEKGMFTQIRAGDRNLFGANKDAWTSGELSQIGYRGDIGLTEPKLLGTSFSATTDLFAEERAEFNQEFGTRSLGLTAGFSRKWLKYYTTGVSFRCEQREQFLKDDRISQNRSEFDPRTIFVTTPSIRYDTRDSFIRPRQGIFSALSVDISKGIKNSLDDFAKYNVDLRFFITPFDRLTLACIGRAGYLDPFGSAATIPEDQLFYLGGTSDVRGYDENMLRFDTGGNPVGGRSAVSGTLEVRFDLGPNYELAGFYDIGRLNKTLNATGSGGLRSSVGAGLRYITPIGPIGLLYGHKLDRREGESYGQFHFSIGYTF